MFLHVVRIEKAFQAALSRRPLGHRIELHVSSLAYHRLLAKTRRTQSIRKSGAALNRLPKEILRGVCRFFHASCGCTMNQCTFKHVCAKCGKPHFGPVPISDAERLNAITWLNVFGETAALSGLLVPWVDILSNGMKNVMSKFDSHTVLCCDLVARHDGLTQALRQCGLTCIEPAYLHNASQDGEVFAAHVTYVSVYTADADTNIIRTVI